MALALGVYQLVLIAVGYGRVRLPGLSARAASFSHRAVGDVILVLLVLTAIACISYYRAEDDQLLHVVAGSALLGTLALKVAVIRWLPRLGGLLPVLGACVFLLLALTWATSAGDLLADR